MEFQIFKPREYLYHFRDPQGVCFTLIKGEKKSVLVDCGYGIYNVREMVEKYIDNDYIVINTHGHMDHTAGNYLFDEVFCPEGDLELFKEHNSKERRERNIRDAEEKGILPEGFNEEKYINVDLNNTKPIKVGTIIDTGNFHIELIPMTGHTQGSIGLLIKEERLLLTGDAAINAIWLFLKESTDRPTYINMLKETKKLPFYSFITGHIMREFPKKFFDYYIEVAEEATVEKSTPTKYSGFERPNTYEYAKMYGDDRIAICYQDPKE